VLVVRNGAAWLRDCIASISQQEYARLGVIAVDNASTDDSFALLTQALGETRVIRLTEDLGVSGSLALALGDERVREADFLLTLHDDCVLGPDAILRMVEAARGIADLDRVGIVGAKILDWDHPRILRDVGTSADRFGHDYSPLESDEMDHGQHDRVREVLAVSGAAMLIQKETWERSGLPDERLGSRHEDLDYCWRARVAGDRVVWTPMAEVRHLGAGAKGVRIGEPAAPRKRFEEERAALASVLKNYALISLLWVLPLFILYGIGKFLGLVLTRRFGEASQLVGAWFWNLFHIGGTWRRRFRVQRARKTRDHAIHRYMVPGSIRLRRWFEAFGGVVQADVVVPGDGDLGEGEDTVSLHLAAGSAIRQHPVVFAWIMAAVLGFFATRHLFGTDQLTGGVVAAMPAGPSDFFRELLSGVRTTGLGGVQAASPGLAALGGMSWASFGNPYLAERILLGVLPALAGISMYRMLLRQTGRTAGSVVGAACYALSPVAFWGFSQGRFAFLIGYAVLPKLAERIGVALGPAIPGRRVRFMVGTGVFLAIAVAFWPGMIMPFLVLFVVYFLAPETAKRRTGGISLLIGVMVAAAALTFPLILNAVGDGGAGLGSLVGEPDVASLLRLIVTPALGSWVVAWFIPAAALFGFALTQYRQAALRFLVSALAGLGLAWAGAAGYLPAPLTDVPAAIALVALSYCGLIGLGLATVLGRLRELKVGPRRLLGGVMVLMVFSGLGLQAVAASLGTWAVGSHELPDAYPIVSDTAGPYHVLWISGDRGIPMPAPGGDPRGIAPDGERTLWFSLASSEGVNALDTGRSDSGPGYDAVAEALFELQSDTTRHLGALLAPMGISHVVAAEGSLSPSMTAALARQVDLDTEPAGGLDIWANRRALPTAAFFSDERFAAVLESGNLERSALTAFSDPEAQRLAPSGTGWRGCPESDGASHVWIGQQFAPGWEATGSTPQAMDEAVGWAMSAPLPASAPCVEVQYQDQWIRTAEMVGLAFLWLVALWITRKPARR